MMHLDDDKDDSLSRLFRQSEENLDHELPSRQVWDRIEARLDAAAAPAKSPPKLGFLQFSKRYAAAASLVLGLVSAGLVWRALQQPENPSLAMASDRASDHIAQTNPSSFSEELPVNANEAEAKYKKEDSVQAANLQSLPQTVIADNPNPPAPVEIPAAKISSKAKVIIENQPIVADSKSSLVTNTIALLNDSPEPTNNPNAGISPEPAAAENFALSDSKSADNRSEPAKKEKVAEMDIQSNRMRSSSNFNYANPSAPSADDEQILNTIALEETNRKKDIPNKANRAASPSKKSSDKEARLAQKLNPRMRMLSWLVGKWQDDSRYDGISYEEWTIKDQNTLLGRGYKIKGKDKLFDETMTLFLDEQLQQIFLQMSVDDYKTPVLYMLSGINPEELTFTLDMPSSQYPDKIILQRSLSGYTIITHNSSSELSPNQQSFLNNRNVVNSQRAVRNMRPTSAGK